MVNNNNFIIKFLQYIFLKTEADNKVLGRQIFWQKSSDLAIFDF